MVLSETRARRRSLSLVLVIRGGLWLGECLGETAGQANGSRETSLEPSARIRILNLDAVARTRDRRSFYESDCQGRFSSLLIAFSSFPLQSALPDRKRTIVSAYGRAAQSFPLDSSPVFSIDPH